ncbi:MAG TPA: tetratricopeptide repeat protein [Pirellulales bacterium]|nr:tetratricopeptide repeat protein [Pirellulales bacterium]
MRKLAAWLVVLMVATRATSRGDDAAESWTGRLVMPKCADVKLHVNDRQIDPAPAGAAFRVRRADGERLWVGRGTIRRSEVVPLDDAVEFFTAEIVREPTSFAYASRAGALEWQKHPFLALFDAMSALRLDPNSAAGYWNRGMSLIYLNDFTNGMADLDEALRLDPKLAIAYGTRASAWSAQREWSKSLADADAVVRLDPEWADAYALRGYVWVQKGDFDNAMRDYDQAIDRDPTNADFLVKRGWLWNRRGLWDKAIIDLDEAIRLNQQCAEAYNNRGFARIARNEFDLALGDFDEATKHDASLAYPYYARGRYYNMQGEHTRAVEELTKAIELAPDEVDPYRERAAAYHQLCEFTLDAADRLMVTQLIKSRRLNCSALDGQNGAAIDPAKINHADTTNIASQGQAAAAIAGTQSAATSTDSAADQPSYSTAASAKPAPPDPAHTAYILAVRMLHNDDERYLDVERALEFATEACKLTEWKRAIYLHTLAEACAELGDFEKAVEWQSKAIERSLDDKEFLAKAKSRLELYRSGKSWSESPED